MNTSNPNPGVRPIGFWIKAADRVLDAAVDAMHAEAGFTRRLWQVLNTIAAHAPCLPETIADALRPMLRADEIEPELQALADRKIVELSGGRLRLTEEGRGSLAELSRRQEALRRRVAEGIDADAYATTIATLARIVDNLSAE